VTTPMILITFGRAHSYLEFIVICLKMTAISETCKNPSRHFKIHRQKWRFIRPETTWLANM